MERSPPVDWNRTKHLMTNKTSLYFSRRLMDMFYFRAYRLIHLANAPNLSTSNRSIIGLLILASVIFERANIETACFKWKRRQDIKSYNKITCKHSRLLDSFFVSSNTTGRNIASHSWSSEARNKSFIGNGIL